MRRTKHISALILIICIAFNLTFNVSAAGLGSVTHETELPLSDDLALKTVETETAAGRVQAYILEYAPNVNVIPQVVYGNKLYGKSSVNEAAAFIEKQGETLIGAVNGDFFTLSNGLPSGIVINGGRLISSDSWKPGIGFFADGSAFIGTPQIKMTLTNGTNVNIPVSYLNKLRTNLGFYMLTEDFSAETRISGAGTNVVLRKNEDKPLKIGDTLSLTVEDIVQTDKSTPIEAGTMVLSVDATGPVSDLPALNIGDQLSFKVTCADTRWSQAVSAVGGSELLISDGFIPSGLSNTREPRTAVGIKADGSLVFLAVDGRQTGYSIGLSLADLADEMAARGCVLALNLDGGGTTTAAVRYPGTAPVSIVNSPSDGSQRAGANYIFFLNKTVPSGLVKRLYLYPYDAVALPGASVPLTVTAVDEGYHTSTKKFSDGVTFKAAGGRVEGTAFIAGEKTGAAGVSVSYSGAENGICTFFITDKVDSIKIKPKGKTEITSLTLDAGETVDLDVSAYLGNRSVYANDSDFIFSVTNGVGSIAKDGSFTATGVTGVTGAITVSLGDTTASLSVAVGKLPELLNGFESERDVFVGDSPAVVMEHETNNAYVRYGRGAGRITYDFSAADAEKAVEVLSLVASNGYSAGDAGYLSLMVYGDGSGVMLSADFSDDPASPKLSQNEYVIDFIGWRPLTFAVPGGGSRLYSLKLMAPDGKTPSGTIYVDQLMTSFAEAGDVIPPVIALSMGGSGSLPVISGSITDHSAIRKSDITTLLDGTPAAFAYAEGSGQYIASLEGQVAAGVHRFTVVAKDSAGNLTRKSFDFTVVGSSTPGFIDMNGHWAAGYVSFLGKSGVLTGISTAAGTIFNPEKNINRLEMAAMLSRYLGLDPADYADVVLPYADLDRIDSWGLGYVKALYAEGIMRGRQKVEGLVFDPAANITREEAVTTLGRTCQMGYPDTQAAVKDRANISGYSLPYMDMFAAMGILSGYSDGTIRPKNNIKRCEIAAIMYRLY